MNLQKQILKATNLFLLVLIFSFAYSIAWAEDENVASLSIQSGAIPESIRIGGKFDESSENKFYSLGVMSFGEVSIVEEYEIPLQERSEFEVVLNPVLSYSFQITEYDSYGSVLSVSEKLQNITLSHFTDKSANLYLINDHYSNKNSLDLPKGNGNGNGNGLTVNIKNTSCEAFPAVSMHAEIKRDDTVVYDASDFSVLENGIAPSSSLSIIPPKSGDLKRTADFVFVFDHSGSMKNDLQNLQAAITDFVNELKKTNIEYNLAFVPYERNPIIEQTFTSDADVFLQSIQHFLDNWPGGGTENAFKALEASITKLTWRPEAQKVLILFTDEDDDFGGPSLSSINNTLTASSAVVYGVVRKWQGNSDAHFCAVGSVTNVTGGRCYDIASPNFNDILNDISQTVGASYLIRYDSSDTSSLNELRTIELSATQGGETLTATTTYNFSQCGNQMHISLGEETLKLSDHAHRQYQAVKIRAIVKSIDSNLPVTAKLFYRQSGSGSSYQSVSMLLEGNDVFKGVIPEQAILSPGVEYYIQASNTKKTITYPASKADENPLAFGVLPNRLPIIVHVPKSSAAKDKDISITAEVTDDTNTVQSVQLFYRYQGSILPKVLDMINTTGNEFRAVIPASTVSGSQIYYYIIAIDDFGAFSISGGSGGASHKIIISGVEYGSSCEVVSSTIKVCGDNKKTVGDISTISGNVTLGHIGNNKPMLGVSTAVDVNLQSFIITTKGTGEVRALGFKRNVQEKPEDFILYSGGFDLDAVSLILKPKNIPNDASVKLFGSQFRFSWPALGSGKILIEKETLEFDGLLLSILNYAKTTSVKLLEIPKVLIDQTGKNTTSAITLTSDLFGKAGGYFGLSKSLKVVEPEMTLDFLKKAITLKGEFSLGKYALPVKGVLKVQKIEIGAGFLFDPFAFNSFSLGATVNTPTKGALNVWSFPPVPASPAGIAPTGVTIGADDIAKNMKGKRAPTYFVTFKGALVDNTYTHRLWKVLDGQWPISGSMTGTVETATGSYKLNADMKALERYTLAQVLLEYNNPGVKFEAIASFPSEIDAFIQGKLAVSHSSNNSGVSSLNGSLAGTLRVPDYTHFIGGMNLANISFKYDQILKKQNDQKSVFEKSLISVLINILWADFRVSYDFVSDHFSANSKSLLSKTSDRKTILVSGYNFGSKQKVFSSRKQGLKAPNVSVNITKSSAVVLIKVNSVQSAAVFDLEIPDGSIYKVENGTPEQVAPLSDVAFFRKNTVANEGYWALKAPELGIYKIKLRNTADIGNYQVSTLYQNIKPTFEFTSPLVDVNVQTGDKINITWVAKDPDDDADISLYFATDKQGHDGRIIMSGLHEDTDSEFKWVVPEGVYGAVYIYAVIDDGNLGLITEYSQGRVVFPDSPAPSSPQNVVATASDGSAMVQWDINDASENVTAYRLNIREAGQAIVNTLVVFSDTYTFNNLGNGVMYEIAVNAINVDGFASDLSQWVSVSPQGLSVDGPSDLLILQKDISATIDGSTVKIEVKVNNVSNYEAYSYKLMCWIGTQNPNHLIGKEKGSNLTGKSVATHNFQFDALVFPKPIGNTVICKISDVSIEELNTINNVMVNSEALRGILGEDISISLSPDWNLVSFPVTLNVSSIEQTIAGISSSIRTIWSFRNGQWKNYDPNNPNFSTLTKFESGVGYWFDMRNENVLQVKGVAASSSINLTAGWNLIGYPLSITKTVSEVMTSIDGKFDSVWGYENGQWKSYDANQPNFSSLTNFKPKSGYWIKAKESVSLSF